MNLSHRLFGVCIGILTVALCCGGCSVPKSPVSPPTAEPQGAPGRAMITGITTETLAEQVRIAVQTTAAVEYTAFTLAEPPRLVLTFPGVTLGDLPRPIPVAGIVRSIEPRLVPEEHAVRLEIALQHMTTHVIEIQGQQCLITLADSGARMADTSSPAPTEMGRQAPAAIPWLASPPGRKSAHVPATLIKGITFDAGSERSIVAVQTAGTPPQVQVKQQRDPTRLALDIKPAHLSPTQQKTLPVRDPQGVVTRLEAIPGADGQAETVRVVIYLRTAVAFEVQQDNDVIRLAMARSSTTAAAARPSVRPGAPMTLASSSGPTPARAGRLTTAPVAAMGTGVVAQVAPGTRRGAAPPAAPGRADSAPAARRADLPPGVGLTESPAFTGEKISLDLQDADINDILRLIADVGGVNIIAGGDVQGKVTTRMVDVPWDQALDVILKINGLAQDRSANIIRVGPLEKFTQERKERLQAQVTEVQAEPLVTRVLPVNYASAKDLHPNVTKLLSNRGTILIDARTNTMILADTQRHLDDVLALVAKLDRPTPQVMIEARIVISSRTFTREFGAQLGLAYSQITDRTFPNRIDVRGGLIPPVPAPGTIVSPPAPANYLLDLPAAVAVGSGGAIGFSLASIGGAILDAQLSALESSGRGKIIASPKIATLDNTEAQIQSGQRIPYQTTSSEGTRTEFVDASIVLKVTPHVTPNDYIGMKITATKNDRGADTAAGLPIINTREATTDMLVKDGDTVVIAGLYQRTLLSNRSGVPGLSSLPLIGALFRRDTERDESDELLIFLTPRIIRQDDAMDKRRATLSY